MMIAKVGAGDQNTKRKKPENIVKNSGEATTESTRDIRRPSRFSSSRFYIPKELPMT